MTTYEMIENDLHKGICQVKECIEKYDDILETWKYRFFSRKRETRLCKYHLYQFEKGEGDITVLRVSGK